MYSCEGCEYQIDNKTEILNASEGIPFECYHCYEWFGSDKHRENYKSNLKNQLKIFIDKLFDIKLEE